ncbi:glycine cleavage system protein GcvH [Candidatus Sumerlaeota bacterium]|nr:glycine cleavage system protein GcvH [Candidatus Sumerlaeota bacterium]
MTEYDIPSDLLYAKTHEWAKATEKEVTVGITSYAVIQMDKEIVNIELPEKGARVKKGESFGVVDSVKAAFDLYAPVTGEVTDVNKPASERPEIVADSPYVQGWLIKIKMNDPNDLNDLMKAADYKNFLASHE